MNIDFARPFAFVFEDQDWMKKILIGGLYALATILCFTGLFALMGYQKRVIQKTADGQDVPLPEFDRFGEDLVEGLKMFLIYLVFLLPSIIIQVCAGGLNGILSNQGGDGAEAGAMISIFAICLYLPLQLVGQFLAPVGILRYVDTGSLGAAFQFGEVIAFTRENFINVLLAFVVGMAANIISSFSLLLLCVGIFFGMAWAMMCVGNAYGQVLKLARLKGTGGAAVVR